MSNQYSCSTFLIGWGVNTTDIVEIYPACSVVNETKYWINVTVGKNTLVTYFRV